MTQAAGDVTPLPGFGRAKQCIILFLYGSPSQLETFDMKPEAPVEIRGTMEPIASSLPGSNTKTASSCFWPGLR